ncbi:hypothetical protein EHI8A_193640 [Entamoeba histolytica HM-1:IMSS-B]|uniref:Uncharacterized protein n=2 Tax=Entamoeba histolytica TaxID=5759 RepID=M3UI27_ENTH1|nr:Hypothetical protein EHI5A_149850 [Entamoeba histolytica KU27]EMH72586.1 hypothetical protein EHI8A_193640 [Entamoeba histolytica HM-1:IMSS-B]
MEKNFLNVKYIHYAHLVLKFKEMNLDQLHEDVYGVNNHLSHIVHILIQVIVQ